MSNLDSTDAVIDALGGTTAVQALLGYSNHSPISNWRSRGRFPPETFLVFQTELERRGLAASPALWSMREPAEGASTPETLGVA